MNLFINKLLSNIPVTPLPMLSKSGYSYSTALQGPDKDTFQKTKAPSEICFTGRRGNGSTKKGDVLKELDNITCPYSGIKMIPSKNMDRIEARLAKCANIHERMNVLEVYRPCMQNLEKEVFQVLKGYEINNPNGSINECLQVLKPECLTELRLDQFKVLDDVDKISNKLDSKTAYKIRKATTDARTKIIEDKQDQIFKRKDLLANIHDITKDHPRQDVVAEMWATADNLPKSTNDFNAFVVKYANRTPQEIAARLLRPSVASIEHIRPANPNSSKIEAGANDLSNFMLASRDWNSGRSNTPLPQFIKEHPNVPKYTQRYINDIIKAIHKGLLEDCDWYPYVIKERLYNESDGMIDLNLENYKKTKEEAFKHVPDDILETYNELAEKNSVIREMNLSHA